MNARLLSLETAVPGHRLDTADVVREASAIFGGVVLHHSPRVEAYLYSTTKTEPDKDWVSKRFVESAGPRWRETRDLSAPHDSPLNLTGIMASMPALGLMNQAFA